LWTWHPTTHNLAGPCVRTTIVPAVRSEGRTASVVGRSGTSRGLMRLLGNPMGGYRRMGRSACSVGRGHPDQQLGLTRDRDRVGGTGRRGGLWALTRVEGVFIVGSSDRAVATVIGVRFMVAKYSRTHMKINKKTTVLSKDR
jgi:hypothetical protein